MPTIMIRGAKTQYDKGVTYETIAKDFQSKYKNRIALVYFNGKMRELHRKVIIRQKEDKGTLTLEFYSREELEELMQRLAGSEPGGKQ